MAAVMPGTTSNGTPAAAQRFAFFAAAAEDERIAAFQAHHALARLALSTSSALICSCVIEWLAAFLPT